MARRLAYSAQVAGPTESAGLEPLQIKDDIAYADAAASWVSHKVTHKVTLKVTLEVTLEVTLGGRVPNAPPQSDPQTRVTFL